MRALDCPLGAVTRLNAGGGALPGIMPIYNLLVRGTNTSHFFKKKSRLLLGGGNGSHRVSELFTPPKAGSNGHSGEVARVQGFVSSKIAKITFSYSAVIFFFVMNCCRSAPHIPMPCSLSAATA